jgi:hypothetical protein
MSQVLKTGAGFVGGNLRGMVCSAAFVSILASQVFATYRIPADEVLMPSSPITPGKVVSQTVIVNDTQWVYLISVPSTYDSTASKVWPAIIDIPTAECVYYAGWGVHENVILTTHITNGGPIETVGGQDTAYSSIGKYIGPKFIIITPFIDGNLAGYQGKPARLISLFKYLTSHVKIDTTSIAMVGQCYGGAVVYDFVASYPKFASSAVVYSCNNSGSSPCDLTLAGNLKTLPFRIYGDANDSYDPFGNTQNLYNAIYATDKNATLIQTHVNAHEIWWAAGIDTTRALYDWMLSCGGSTAVNQKPHNEFKPNASSVVPTGTHQVEVFDLKGKAIVPGMNQGAHLMKVCNGVRSVSKSMTTR